MGHCDYQGGLAGDHNTTTINSINKQQMQPSGGVDLEMLTMLSASQQDNGKSWKEDHIIPIFT